MDKKQKKPGFPGTALQDRALQIEESKIVSLTSPILHGIFLIPRILPPNMEIRLVFYFNSPEFCLIAPPAITAESTTATDSDSVEKSQPEKKFKCSVAITPKYDIKIHGAKLYLQKYHLTPQALQKQQQILCRPGALYPTNILNTITIAVDKGGQSLNKTLIIGRTIPRMVTIAQIERDAIYGSLHHSPFDFRHFNLSQLYLEYEGSSFPPIQYQLNFETGDYGREWMILQHELNFAIKKWCLTVMTGIMDTHCFLFP